MDHSNDNAIAGAAGVWLMDLVSTALYQQEDQTAKDREEAARAEAGGKAPAGVAAVRLAQATGAPLTTGSEDRAATAPAAPSSPVIQP